MAEVTGQKVSVQKHGVDGELGTGTGFPHPPPPPPYLIFLSRVFSCLTMILSFTSAEPVIFRCSLSAIKVGRELKGSPPSF